MPLLRIEQLSCMAGYRPLFEQISTDLDGGQWLSLTGPNGTGKTTLLRALAGLVRPVAGHVLWRNERVNPATSSWRGLIHYLGHSTALKDSLSAEENLALQLALDTGKPTDTKAVNLLLTEVGLHKRRHLPVARLSAGQKRRVQLARLMASRRPLWLLDEPSNALDAEGESLLGRCIDKHLRGGGCAIVATHQPLKIQALPRSLNLAEQRASGPAVATPQ